MDHFEKSNIYFIYLFSYSFEGEDPTVQKLERAVAEKLGKEAGLFVPSGTMGNFVSVMTHCWGRGLEIILGDKAHIHLYEQGNIAQVRPPRPIEFKKKVIHMSTYNNISITVCRRSPSNYQK